MLINLSNLASKDWDKKQMKIANVLYYKVIDVPIPIIKPNASIEQVIELAQTYKLKCMEIFDNEKENYLEKHNAVHISGELSFVYNLVFLLHQEFIRTVVSTGEYFDNEDDNVVGKASFLFNQFRSFHIENNMVF